MPLLRAVPRRLKRLAHAQRPTAWARLAIGPLLPTLPIPEPLTDQEVAHRDLQVFDGIFTPLSRGQCPAAHAGQLLLAQLDLAHVGRRGQGVVSRRLQREGHVRLLRS